MESAAGAATDRAAAGSDEIVEARAERSVGSGSDAKPPAKAVEEAVVEASVGRCKEGDTADATPRPTSDDGTTVAARSRTSLPEEGAVEVGSNEEEEIEEEEEEGRKE